MGSDDPPSGASLVFDDTGAKVGLASTCAVVVVGGLLTAERGLSGAVACFGGACCVGGSTAGVREGVRLGVLMAAAAGAG